MIKIIIFIGLFCGSCHDNPKIHITEQNVFIDMCMGSQLKKLSFLDMLHEDPL